MYLKNKIVKITELKSDKSPDELQAIGLNEVLMNIVDISPLWTSSKIPHTGRYQV